MKPFRAWSSEALGAQKFESDPKSNPGNLKEM